MLATACYATVDDLGEMRADAQSWAAAAIETQSMEKAISKDIKVGSLSTAALYSYNRY